MSTITHGLLATVLAATKENAFACIGSVFNWGHAVSLWLPSQNGCLLLLPQEHQKYDFPSSTSTAYGDF
jgi:hypothetical protein